MLTSRGPLTVRVQRDVPKYRGATAVSDGDGTHERPLLFVLLACHADMADDASIDTTERATRGLAETVLARLKYQQGTVGQVLQSTNADAVNTGRYYSIVAGRLTLSHVIIAALGAVDVTLVSTNVRKAIVTPNVVRVGEFTILDASFGIGFKKDAVNEREFDLSGDERMLLIIGENGVSIGSRPPCLDAEAFIEDVVNLAHVSLPIVALMG